MPGIVRPPGHVRRYQAGFVGVELARRLPGLASNARIKQPCARTSHRGQFNFDIFSPGPSFRRERQRCSEKSRVRDVMHDELVIANRILAHERIVDAYGHVSVRHPEDPSVFILARALSPALVKVADLMEFDLSGEPRHGDDRVSYVERFIHAAVYAARPEVGAVVHSHAPALLPFTVGTIPLKPVIHVAGMIGPEVPKWDIADRFGETDLLVRTLEQGADLVRTMDSCSCALMRGHGAVVVGATLKEAVLRSIFLQANAATQLQAGMLGEYKTLSVAEAELSAQTHLKGAVLDRAWEFYAAPFMA